MGRVIQNVKPDLCVRKNSINCTLRRRIDGPVCHLDCCLEYLILTRHSLSMRLQNNLLRCVRIVTPNVDEEAVRKGR